MAVGIITGSGTHALPGFDEATVESVPTPFGEASVTRGSYDGVSALHVSRHGAGHARLSNHVTHRPNIWALKELGAEFVIACTACGAVDPTLPLGSLVVFDDLHFPFNRLPDGSLCTFFTEAGDVARGHWILHGGPFSAALREALLAAAEQSGHAARDGGAYGHVDGPRFNTPCEIAALADYANEVRPGEPTPIAKLIELMGASSAIFADVIRAALPRLSDPRPVAAGTVYRFAGPQG
ncbi:MAG: phosphorylase [Solirubrobacteraceae bacterium]